MKWATLLVIVLISFSLKAQHKSFQFGFKAGMNAGWYNSNNDDYNNNGLKFGGSWGFAADFFILENYSFTTGFDVLYLNGSMSYPDNYYFSHLSFPTSGILQRDFRTKYIKIPLIFTMKTNLVKKIRYYGQIGFGLGILVSANANDEFTADIDGSTESSTSNIYDELRFSRESVILGAGVEIPVHKSTYVRVGLLFDNALFNIMKGNNSLDPSIKNNGRNSFIELSTSLLF